MVKNKNVLIVMPKTIGRECRVRQGGLGKRLMDWALIRLDEEGKQISPCKKCSPFHGINTQ